MSLLDDIKRDMAQGTPGLWKTGIETDSHVDDPTTCWMAIGPEDFNPVAIAVNEQTDDCQKPDCEVEANTRRCARVPDMERALLAAEEMARAVEGWKAEEIDGAVIDDARRVLDALAAFRKATE